MSAGAVFLAVAISSAAGIKEAVWEGREAGSFAVTGTVAGVIAGNRSFTLFDDTGYCYLRTTNSLLPAKASLAVARGHIGVDRNGWRRAFADSVEIVGEGVLPEPLSVGASDLSNAFFDNRLVTMRGIVAAVEGDEIDPDWNFMVMRSKTGNFLAAVYAPVAAGAARPDIPVSPGATVRLTGVANVLPDGGKRKFKMPQITLPSPESIQIVATAPKSPREAPEIVFDSNGIANGQYKSPALISQMGMRRVTGDVVAIAARRDVYISVRGGQVVCAELDRGVAPPSVGERIVAAGFPETNLFILKLNKARWEASSDAAAASSGEKTWMLPQSIPADEVLREHYGHMVGLNCRIVAVPGAEAVDAERMQVLFGGRIVPVDISGAPELCSALSPGDEIEVRGLCVLNTSEWRLGDMFPAIDGFTVVVRGVDEVRLLKAAPWWTTERLKVAVAALIAVTLVLSLCVGSLRRIIVRKSRQLFRAEIGKVETELRVSERTRLAVEIHDSVSQYLVGVAYQLDAAAKALRRDAAAAGTFLATAQKVLGSCREELRRCISDLRGNALEMADMSEAIRTTVQPVVRDARLSVRFAVRRGTLSDMTAHAILCIVRELAANAVRHGGAKHVKIAGASVGTAIRLSVRDDGSGFDAARHPGPAEGHFGLQGIRERVAKLGGIVRIESGPDQGSCISVEILK